MTMLFIYLIGIFGTLGLIELVVITSFFPKLDPKAVFAVCTIGTIALSMLIAEYCKKLD